MRNFIRFLLYIIVASGIVLLAMLILQPYIASEEITIFVEKIEKITTDDGEVYYLVYTENEIFENRDNIFHKKDDTLRIIKKIKKNNRYRVRVVGYSFANKLPFFPEHRNIASVLKGPEFE